MTRVMKERLGSWNKDSGERTVQFGDVTIPNLIEPNLNEMSKCSALSSEDLDYLLNTRVFSGPRLLILL